MSNPIRSKLTAASDLVTSVRRAAALSRRSSASILAEIRRLQKTAQLFGVSDYFTYRLYLDPPGGGRKEDFAGWRMEDWLNDRLNPLTWRGIVDDKSVFLSVCELVGLPVPNTTAIYHPGGRKLGGRPTLRTPQEMADFLRARMKYPFFAKPVHGTVGGGAMSVDGIDLTTDELLLSDGRRLSVTEFVASLERRSPGVTPEAGYLFQERLQQHQEIRKVCGDTIGCIRFVVLAGRGDTQIHRTVWKIPTGTQMTDHFHLGLTGNLVASLDRTSGVIVRVVQGVSFDQRLVDRHPDSGASLIDWTMPLFREASALILEAAAQFPMLHLQHWDVAITETGPVVIEMNASGSIYLPQYGSGAGLFDREMREFVARFGRGGR